MGRFFKKVFSFLIFVCILLLFCYFCNGWIRFQVRKAKGMYYIHKADQAYAQDNISKTLELYNRGLWFYPEHHEAWLNLGNIYVVYDADRFTKIVKLIRFCIFNTSLVFFYKIQDFALCWCI